MVEQQSKRPRLVVKVGTSSLLRENASPSSVFDVIAESLRALSGRYDVLLVTSGAIGFGMRATGVLQRPTGLRDLQALSMIGQPKLMDRWTAAFLPVKLGQVLVTSRELRDEAASQVLCSSLEAVWELGALPVLNENDAITTEEITFGDNDKLAVEVAIAVGAEALVLLSDQDGIMEDFGTDRQKVLSTVSIHDAARHVKGGSSSGYGKGGADSKVFAARLALEHGIAVFIANAGRPHAVQDVLAGIAGTKVY